MEIGPEKLTPQEIAAYRSEFSRGVKLFHDALEQYRLSDEPHQKEEFRKVMEKVFRTLNEIVQVSLKEEALKWKEELAKDYQQFSREGSEEEIERLRHDLESIESLIASQEKKEL